MDANNTVATAIKAELEEQGMSRSALAEKSAIPYTTLGRKLKAGGGDFTIMELARIADALGVSPIALAPTFTPRRAAA